MNAATLLLPCLLLAPAAAALLLLAPPSRALRAAIALVVLALGALALRAAGAAPPGMWRLALGPVGLPFLLDRLSALLWLLVALLACLAAGARATPDAAGRRADLGIVLVAGAASIACLALNLLCQLLAFEAAAIALGAQAARHLEARAARALWLLESAIALDFAVALGCLYHGGGSFDAAALALIAPAAPAAAALWLTLAAYLLFAGFAATLLALPLALALPAALPVAIRLGGVVLGGVGAAALMRLYTLVFPCFTAGPCGAAALALPLGLAMLAGGALATLFARTLRELVAYVLFATLGVQLVALGSFRAGGLAAALLFLGHALVGSAALLLSAEALAATVASPQSDRATRMARRLLSAAWLLAACAPPSLGFVAAIATLRASAADALSVWTLFLVSTLLMATALGRRWVVERATPPRPPRLLPAALAVTALGAMAALAGPGFQYATDAARQLFDRAAYRVAPVGNALAARHTRETPAQPALAPAREAP